MIKYYKSANLITLNEMIHLDCLRTINFMNDEFILIYF